MYVSQHRLCLANVLRARQLRIHSLAWKQVGGEAEGCVSGGCRKGFSQDGCAGFGVCSSAEGAGCPESPGGMGDLGHQ